MLDAKNISDRLLRLELFVSNLEHEIKELREQRDADRLASTAASYASRGARTEAERWERAFTQGR